MGLPYSVPPSTCPHPPPRAGTRHPGTASVSQIPLKWPKLANPKPASLVPRRHNHSKGSLSMFFSPPLCSWPALGLCAVPLLLGAVGNKLVFQWQSSSHLWALQYLKSSGFIGFLKNFYLFRPHRSPRGILVPRPGIEPGSRQWECQVLTTGPPENSHKFSVNTLHFKTIHKLYIMLYIILCILGIFM